jgi:Ca2+-binding RTX toxin-like protein
MRLETEPNDGFDQADPIGPAGGIAGQVARHDDIDVFRVAATAAGMLTIAFDAPTDSAYLDYFTIGVFDAGGNPLALVATGSDRTFETAVSAPGAYHVVVAGGAYAFDSGEYRLEVSARASDGSGFEQEPNDDFANPLLSGSPRLGRIATPDDVDWFHIDVAAPSELAIALDSPAAAGVLEYFGVWVLDESGNLLASRSTGGDTVLAVNAPAAGSYFIAVTAGLLAHHDGQYALTATAIAATLARESETNDSAATADALALGGSVRGQLSWFADDDFYAVSLASAGRLTVEFDGPTDSTYANFFLLEVYDAEGVLLAMRDTGGDVAFDVAAAAPGTYFVSVRAAGALFSDGEYRLSVGAAPEDQVPADAVAGSAANESIAGTGDADIIYGMGGNDRIDGGGGIDTIVFRTAADNLSINTIGGLTAIRGGYAAGEHAFSVSRVWGAERLQTWSGAVNLATGAVAPVFGTFGSEAITGTSADDVIDAMGGSDLIDGGAGADTLALFGARDQFAIQSVAGITRIRGGEGTHEYAGHTITVFDVETLAFNQAQTRALETNGVNKIFGSAASDTLVGSSSDDIVDAQGGNDVVDGGMGQDTLVFFGRLSDFTIAFPSASGGQVVIDGNAGSEHAGRRVAATNVETLAFLDRSVAVATAPKVVLAPATTFLAEGGPGAVVQISLSAAPDAAVTVALAGGPQLSSSATVLSFGPSNWGIPQSVIVQAIDDSAVEQTHGGSLIVSAVAEDGLYKDLPATTLGFTISDNDQVTTGSVSGRFWNDLNRNRVFDAAEMPLAGWTVFDDANRNGRRDTGEAEAKTDMSGAYRLDGLAPGAHTIVARVESGWIPTFPTSSDASATIVVNQVTAAAVTTAADTGAGQFSGQPSYANLGTATNIAAFRADPRFAGIDGAGYSVVVIDTGIDLDHPFFGPDANGDGIADRIVFQQDFFGANDPSAADGNGHGTHVAGIVASADPAFPGVAPGANLIILKVFPDGAGGASFGDITEAANWVVANAKRYNVVSVNLSLGSAEFHTVPVSGPLSSQFKALANSGVIVVSASGNAYAGFQGVAYPSADPYSLSVGAVWPRGGSFGTRQTGTTDAIAFFSQRDDTESDIFAPGVLIESSFLNGTAGALSGTSMASPQVAGMIALAQQLAERELGRRLSYDEIRSLLKSTGEPIVDGDDENDSVANTGLTFQRIDMLAIAEAILGMKQLLPVSHAVDIVAGQASANRNFGFAAAQPTQALSGDDLIVGSPFGEIIRGGGGADRVDAGDGDDSVFGEAGDDFLSGGRGNDLIDGGAGTDAAEYANAGGPVVAWLDAGGSGGASGADGADTLAGIENLRGGAFADTLTGDAGDNALAGDRGDDRLNGGAGNDLLDGGEGNDVALYALARSAYEVALDIAGVLTVRALSGPAGTDTLRGIETLRFADRDLAGTFSLSVGGPAAAQAEGNAGSAAFIFSVTRLGDISGATSVMWAVTGNGTDPAGAADFAGGALPSGTVSFVGGEQVRTIVVEVAGDTAVEADESFALTLFAPSPGSAIVSASATATIANDDTDTRAPALQPGGASVNAAGTQAMLSFDEALAGTVDPGAFSVVSGGQPVAVVAATVAARSVQLSLARAIDVGEDATIAYGDPPGDQSTGVLQDIAGNDVAGFTLELGARGTSLSGIAYHWKSRALLENTSVTAVGDGKAPGGASPFEVRGLSFDATGDARFEIWADMGAGVSAFAFDLRAGGTAPVSWTPGSALAGWSATVQAGEGRLSVDASGPGAVAGVVALGSAVVDLAPGTATALVDILSASLDDVAAPGFATPLARQKTAADGGYALLDPAGDVTTLSLSRGTADTGGAIGAADALAALKIAVGRNPNPDPDGGGPQRAPLLSPYQFIAADVNGDGRVTSVDALAILKMAVQRPDAPARDWIFVREDADFWNESGGNVTLDRDNVAFQRAPFAAPAAGAQDLDFVGILKGDVNGSWTPASGAQTLPQGYLASLAQSLGVPVDIWG